MSDAPMNSPAPVPSSTASAPTSDATSITLGSGESPATFEELESVMAHSSKAAKAAKAEAKAAAKEAIKESKKEDVTVAKESKDEKDSADSKKEGKEKAEGAEKASAELEAKSKAKQIAKGKLGDKELDLDLDTVLTHKVAGKEETITLRELLNDKSGKTQWDRKFSELDKERKGWQTKVTQANEKIAGIVNEQDPELRLFKLAEFSGKDPVAFRQQFLDDNIKLLEKWYGMSDDERKADALAYENKVLRHRQETSQKDLKTQQAIAELDKRARSVQAAHQVGEDDFLKRYEDLKSLKQQGKIEQALTPEFIAETIVKDRHWIAAEKALSGAEVSSDQLLDLVETSYANKLTPAQTAEIADELWGPKSRSAVVKQTADEREKFLTGKSKEETVAKKRQSQEEPLFFDQMS